ncbi:MAG TPA: CotH kinase family protein [Bacteroidales bacterium]|nr:CotH kinase family protein [Bacteroidales bacterium]HPS18380.1 CotH kinase family protein [Bacteroidales bacterium]
MKTKFLALYTILSAFIVNPIFSQDELYNTNSVREIRIYFQESNWDHILDSLHLNVGEDGRLLGNISIDGNMLNGVGVRYKGFSSWGVNQEKTPFNIDLEYTINNQNYKGYTKLKLGNVIEDPSFVREVLSYEMIRKYMPASLTGYANVYVNDTLIGLYTNVEAVDKNFLDKHFNSQNNSFFKGAPETLNYSTFEDNADLNYHGTDTAAYKPYYKLESDNSETSWLDLVRLINILNNDTINLDTILNVDRALWMHAINYTLVNLDSYIGYSQNYYLYMDDNGRFNPIPWDFNMSFGSFRETDGINASITLDDTKSLNPLSMIVYSHSTKRPLIVNLIQNSTYKRMYLAHMRTIINENLRNNLYYTRGQELQNMIDGNVQNDPNKFYGYQFFHSNLDTTAKLSSSHKIIGLKELINARIAYLDTFPGFQGAPVISDITEPDYPIQGNDTWITAKVSGGNEVLLGYRFKTNGIFKKIHMYDDGNHHDGNAGDGVFGTSFILSGTTVQYYIYAQNDSAGIFSPERAEYEFYNIQPKLRPGDIVFNEIMTQNSSFSNITDQDGEHDAWIEIFNTTGEKQNLKNLYLSDEDWNLTKWAFPDTSIDKNSFLIIWADNDNSQNGLHTNFSLPENNRKLFLSYGNNQLIDTVRYGVQEDDNTYGRYPNGYGPFVFMQPTFAKHNYVGTTPPVSDFLLYPNPATSSIYMDIPNPEDYHSYSIYNSIGQKIISGDFNFEASPLSSAKYKIDVSDLNKGIYIIKASTTYKSVFKKFVIK